MTSLESLRRRASADCWSDLEIDAYLTAEALGTEPEAEAQRSAVHLAECAACQARVTAYRHERRRFAEEMPLRALAGATLDAIQQRSLFPRWLPRAAGALALAAGLLIVASLSLHPERGPERIKGSPSFIVVVKRGERVFQGEDGGEYRAGDRLRFQYSTDRLRSFAVFSLEASGRVSQLVPAEGDRPVAVSPGSRIALGGSIELDDARGLERLLGIFCEATFDLRAVHKTLAAAGGQIDPMPKLGLAPDCTTTIFTLKKP